MTPGVGERWSPEQEGDPDEHRHASDCREEHGVARDRRPPAAVAGRAFLCTPTTRHSLLAMVITIRPARPDDAPGVRYVGTVSWPATYGSDKGAAYVMSGLERVRGFYLREGFEATASLWPGSDARWLRWTGVADQ